MRVFFLFFLFFTKFCLTQVISSGTSHSAFICSDGRVMTTGRNLVGELGSGDTIDRNSPYLINNLQNIVALGTGVNHTIFLRSNGQVYGVGKNDSGELGDGTNVHKEIPVLIESLNNIVKLSCGVNHSVYLRNDGKVFANGANSLGQLGMGNFYSPVYNPTQLSLISDVIDISAGNGHTIFLKNDGTVWVSGINNLYQLGLGDNNNRNVPTQIFGLSEIVSISGGGGHSLFLKSDGTVYTCGQNVFGQLGLGDNVTRVTPVIIPNLNNVVFIAAGLNYSVFVKDDGTAYSCGANTYGQLGLGDYNDRNQPTIISQIVNVDFVELGSQQTFFVQNDLSVFSCGKNIYGELGTSNYDSINSPSSNNNLCTIFNEKKKVTGKVFYDFSEDCLQDSQEQGVHSVHLLIEPGNIIVETNPMGLWGIDSLEIGTYTVTIDSNNYESTCNNVHFFTVQDPESLTIAPIFGVISNDPCPEPTVSVNMPFMRPCFTNQQIYVQACNEYNATGVLPEAYSIVDLDPNLIFENASIPFTALGNNQYRFEHDTLYPGQCVNYTISAQVSCDAILGQTLCMEANLYPVADCVLDSIPTPPTGEVSPCTLPWDQSSLSVNGWCANDSIYFRITNTGEFGGGDMECYSPVRIFVDGVLIQLDSILLQGGETFTYTFLGTGETWILQADQHPLHPGNSHPNAHVENCGTGTWTPDLVNNLPLDDADPVVDIYCGIVTGSYDPNDKRGFPNGISIEHFIAKNQDLEYIIRFQNTGTDTAFTVVVRDTLDENFNIFTVTPSVSSHPYSFRMYGPRVLEWTFANILLPDSTTNEPLSNGFLTFTVKQNPNLAEGTLLKNNADIYFDFNEPIITNETTHKISYHINTLASLEKLKTQKSNLKLYPNPTNSVITIDLNNFSKSVNYKIYTLSGKLLQEKRNSYGQKISVDVKNLENGLYFIEIEYDTKIEVLNFVKN
jgi:uncharacterized repeat protein (TIGR01451 family)